MPGPEPEPTGGATTVSKPPASEESEDGGADWGDAGSSDDGDRGRLVDQERLEHHASNGSVDAFTAKPFAGNPAAICILSGPADEGWMQDVAREMNLSETAFAHRVDDGYRLRWFTPAVEVDLCGHATLATAHVLWEEGHIERDADLARFQTRSGVLTAERRRGTGVELDFPAEPAEPTPAPAGSCRCAGGSPAVRRPEPIRLAGRGRFRGRAPPPCAPDMTRLAAIPTRGVIVTSRAESPGFDFVWRVLRATPRRSRRPRVRLGTLLPCRRRSVRGSSC